MKKHKDDRVTAGDEAPEVQRDAPVLTFPLGSLRSGRLLFPSGAGWLELTTDAAPSDLFEACFVRYPPHISAHDGVVAVHYGRLPLPGLLAGIRPPRGVVRLNGSIPWEIEIRSGVSHLKADLAQLQLQSLDILGGASRVRLRLSRPVGTTFIYLADGISQGVMRVPAAVGLRLRLRGGASDLTFDQQHVGAVGGEISFQSAGYAGATSRYDISIAGGATSLAVVRDG